MSKSRVILLKMACWLVIGGFAVAGVRMHRLLLEAARPDPGIWCGNTVINPLGVILSIGSPLGVVAVVLLGMLWRRGLAAGWPVMLAALLILVGTTSLLVYGIRFCRDSLPGELYLSDIVWWMGPVGRLLGV